MTPVPGHAVLIYTTDERFPNPNIGFGPYLATVTKVWSHACVNLEVQRGVGDKFELTSVNYADQLPGPEFTHVCCWMWPSARVCRQPKAICSVCWMKLARTTTSTWILVGQT